MKFLKSLLRIAGLLSIILLLLAGTAATFVYFKVKPSRLQILMWSRLAAARYNQAYNTTISPEDAVADARRFFSDLERVHPDPSGNIGPAAYAALKEGIVKEAERLPVNNGEVQVRDLAYLLYKAAAGIRDGHTRIEWTYNPDYASDRRIYPAVSLDCVNGEFIVNSFRDNLRGRKLRAMDSVPARKFLAPILERQSAETWNYACRRFTSREAFWWDFSGLLAGRSQVTLTTEGDDGKDLQTPVPLLTRSEFYNQGQAPRYGSGAGSPPLTLYPEEKTAWFYYPSFQYSDSEKKRIAAVFAAINKAGVRDLIIDISDNGGGDTRIGDFILSHLTEKPFMNFSFVRQKISPEAVRILRYLGSEPGELSGRVGEILESTNTPSAHQRPADFYTGRTWLLVSGATFSSATDFAAVVRDYGLGKIIGWETGGVPVCFGEAIPLTLPYSSIQFSVSDKQFFGPKPRPGDNLRGVLPDMPVSQALLKKHRGDIRRLVLRGMLGKRSMDSVSLK